MADVREAPRRHPQPQLLLQLAPAHPARQQPAPRCRTPDRLPRRPSWSRQRRRRQSTPRGWSTCPWTASTCGRVRTAPPAGVTAASPARRRSRAPLTVPPAARGFAGATTTAARRVAHHPASHLLIHPHVAVATTVEKLSDNPACPSANIPNKLGWGKINDVRVPHARTLHPPDACRFCSSASPFL